MEEYEGVLIERCVKNRYSFLETGEQRQVVKNAKEMAKSEEKSAVPSFSERKREVYEKIQKYLNESDTIVPCGFVDFRMRDLYYYVENLVKMGADMFFDMKEYEEFTYLLSLFLEEKEPREEIIHVLWTDEGVKLLNKRRRDVTKKYEKEFINVAKEKNVTDEDLAISATISAAPEKLFLHKPPESPLKETLIKIFGERCKVCTGCNICKNS